MLPLPLTWCIWLGYEGITTLFVFGIQLCRLFNNFVTIVTGAQSAWDMLQEEETIVHITTSCADLDNILGGGISCKEVTEIGLFFYYIYIMSVLVLYVMKYFFFSAY